MLGWSTVDGAVAITTPLPRNPYTVLNVYDVYTETYAVHVIILTFLCPPCRSVLSLGAILNAVVLMFMLESRYTHCLLLFH